VSEATANYINSLGAEKEIREIVREELKARE